jgi:CheY-like chemotaxis protein
MSDSRRLLVVGRNPDVPKMLRDAGLLFDDAKDSTEAFSCVGANHYDLVVTDLETPGEDDLALLREIRNTSSGTYSGSGDPICDEPKMDVPEQEREHIYRLPGYAVECYRARRTVRSRVES